jgi:hypothetical protein
MTEIFRIAGGRRTMHYLRPCHFRTVPAVPSAFHGAFLNKNGGLWTIWDQHFGRDKTEKWLNLKIHTDQMMVQDFRQLLPELPSHRLARI